MTGHLSVRNSIWRFLQAESLEVNTNAAVRDDEVGVHRTLHPSSILTEKREKLLDTMDKHLHPYALKCSEEELKWFYISRSSSTLTCCTCVAERNPAGQEAEGCC